jgi:phosphoenolpyruvate synthase/pyruvate phosphate dikinase
MKQPGLIKRLRAGLTIDETGNKANSLIFLHRYGFKIPTTYLVTTGAWGKYIKEGPGILIELRKEIGELPDSTYAVRSSTTAEDSMEFSCAGQFQTFINVSGTENILHSVQKVWDSASMLEENEYLKKTNIAKLKCGVIIQEMIQAKMAGVCFSKNPVTNLSEIIIEAVEGPGEDLVQKGVTPFRWRIRNGVILEGNDKHPDLHIIQKLAFDTEKLKKRYGHHVDIEWVYDGKEIYYLQLRPITGGKHLSVYSNKMAKEMLPGQIKPLVWSVNIPMVNGTWIQLLSEITGPLAIKPEDLAKSFYFRTYFDIAALSKILNEFGMSSDSLETLMLTAGNSKPSFKPGMKALRHTFRMIRFIDHKLHFEKTFLREYKVLKSNYSQLEQEIQAGVTEDSFQGFYHTLFREGKKLAYLNIIIPILMQIFHKKLRKQLAKLNLDYDQIDFNKDFPALLDYSPLVPLYDIRVSLEALPAPIQEQCISIEAMKSIPETFDVSKKIDTFINDFGHLSDSGNDFSSPKWKENPAHVLNMIRKAQPVQSKPGSFTLLASGAQKITVGSRLLKSYSKAGRFKLYREQISSLYISGYGLFRTLFLDLGKILVSREILESPDDILYLKKEEIDLITQEFSSSQIIAYQELIRERKREIEETKDFVLPPVIYGDQAPILEIGKIKNHPGVGTSSGVYRGKTRAIRGMEDFEFVQKGEILIIPFSDVSWTPILTQAGAIVSETGGILSHCSIMARELGIPAMVSVANACALGTGLTATVDGSNGILTIHDYE